MYKKSIFSRCRLAVVCMLILGGTLLNSCKEDAVSTSDLLSTVPSSAGMVVGFNTGSVLTKAGCKVDGMSITPGSEVSAWIDSRKDVRDSNRNALKLILSGESGVNPLAAILFTDAYNTYLTAMLADTEKFIQFVEGQTGDTFADAGDDVRMCGNVAVKGAQCWVCVSAVSTIDPKAVANYAALSAERSFMANAYSKNIAEMTSDIVGWGDIKSFARYGMARGQFSMMNLVAGMLFENASAVAFDVKFEKGEGKATVRVLNDKGETAKYLLPASKIDVSTVKSLGGSAEAVAAMSITKEFTQKIEKIGSSLGGNMFGMFTEALKPVDGTVAVAFGDIDNLSDPVSGVVTTDGNTPREFMTMLSGFGSTRVDGKLVCVVKGTVNGGIQVEAAADELKGSTAGVVADLQAGEAGDTVNNGKLKTFVFALDPDGNGLRCRIKVTSVEPDRNLLLTLIEQDTNK